MRFLSIAVFVGLVAATHISTITSENRVPGLQPRDKECKAGEWMNSQRDCKRCPNGSDSTAGSSECTCNADYYSSTGKATTVPCTACSPGYTSPRGSMSCTACPADTYESGGTCKPCDSGYFSNGGASSCTKDCGIGKRTVGPRCEECPAGTYSAGRTTSCSACPAGMISSTGSSTCSVCPVGSVPFNGGSCTQCGENTVSNGSQCLPCPGAPAGSTSCGPQPSGRLVVPRQIKCTTPGYQLCPVLSGMGGSECVNVFTTLDSCGGCVGPEGEEHKYTGRDCSAIPNVNKVRCDRGQCNIMSCRRDYVPEAGICAPSKDSIKARHHRALSPSHDSF